MKKNAMAFVTPSFPRAFNSPGVNQRGFRARLNYRRKKNSASPWERERENCRENERDGKRDRASNWGISWHDRRGSERFKTGDRTNEIRVVEHFSVDVRRLRRKWRRFYSPAHGPLRAKTISPLSLLWSCSTSWQHTHTVNACGHVHARPSVSIQLGTRESSKR